MNVPVLWVSWHEEILARGYADQALLEAVFSRELWTPPGVLHFEHHEIRGDFPKVDGAVVVLPARHHAGEEDVSRLKKALDEMSFSLLILAGDEEWVFPWQEFPESETHKVWVMAPEPEHANLSYRIPGGWYTRTREDLRAAEKEANERSLGWFFAGQVRNPRRVECVQTLRNLPNGFLLETAGFMQGMPPADYVRLTASAKVIPCPSGPIQVDTARPLTAMEAGCLPIVDLIRPGEKQGDYWRLVFGEDCPLIGIRNWALFPDVLNNALDSWPDNANRVYAWWQQWKRQTAHKLDDDIRAVSGIKRELKTPDDLITVIVTTSPIVSHPSTEIIDETIKSIRTQLPIAEIIVVIDGIRPEQEKHKTAYDEYVRQLLWKTNFEWHNVVPVMMNSWAHQANMTRRALEFVTTPQILFVEHDTPIIGEIDWNGLCGVVQRGQANCIRLHPEAVIHPEWEYLMVDHETQEVDGIPLRRTMQFWQRPHLASTRWYRDRVMPVFPAESRTFIEDVLYGVVANDWEEFDESGWWDWRLWVYTPDGDMKRSGHTNGRGDEKKYDMWLTK